jgi:ribonuclease HII
MELTFSSDAQDEGLLAFENALWRRGHVYVAGCDEAGRGPLAGPVVAAAVVVPHGAIWPGVNDSKQLTDRKRRELLPMILKEAAAVAVAAFDHLAIDRDNILRCSLAGMALAVERLGIPVTHVLVDGNRRIPTELPQTTIVKGDSRSLSVAAAGIVAKVIRDDIMLAMHRRWPGYGFDRHMGYPTLDHRMAIRRLGACAIHRRTFKGVAGAMEGRSCSDG